MLIPQYQVLVLKLSPIYTVSLNTVFSIPQNQCYPGTPCTYFLFQSPFHNIFDIQAYANVWGVPCDRTTDCEDGSDESLSLCGIPKEIVSYCLSSGYGILFLIMLVALVYIRKTYVTYFRCKETSTIARFYFVIN